MDDFYQIKQESCRKPPCFEGMCDIREGLRDIGRGIRALDRGLDEIRTCHVRDGVHDLRDGMRDITEGVNDIIEGLTDLGINKECEEYCEIQKDVKSIIEGLQDIVGGINDVEQKNRCGCRQLPICEDDRGRARTVRLFKRERRHFVEGILDIQEGIRDIKLGFYDLVEDLKELFYIPEERHDIIVRSPLTETHKHRCRAGIQPVREEPFRRIKTVYLS